MRLNLVCILCFIFLNNNLTFGQEYNNLNKAEILNILEGEWEREAEGNEKNTCGKNSDRFILSIIVDSVNCNADGYLEYFTYLSSDPKKKICYLEHLSFSSVFFDIIDIDYLMHFDITGYLWSDKWYIKIISSDKIEIDDKHYTRSKLIKDDKWYKNNNLHNEIKRTTTNK